MDKSKSIVIIGGSGFIGRHLIDLLLLKNYQPIVVTRKLAKVAKHFSSKVTLKQWDSRNSDELREIINGVNGIINLAGETIAVRWSRSKKESILNSRIETTKAIVDAINKCINPPEIFLQGSAIGYYSYDSTELMNESSNSGRGFLSEVVTKWESIAKNANPKTRLVILRTGVVLANDGGFISKILPSVKSFFGGWFGNGNQYLSWIHIDDLTNSMLFLLENSKSRGIYNAVTPNTVKFKVLVKGIGKRINRPVWIPVPEFIIKLIYGEMAKEVLLANQKVSSAKLVESGFVFKYQTIDSALDDLF